jgi:hypothetical protein
MFITPDFEKITPVLALVPYPSAVIKGDDRRRSQSMGIPVSGSNLSG